MVKFLSFIKELRKIANSKDIWPMDILIPNIQISQNSTPNPLMTTLLLSQICMTEIKYFFSLLKTSILNIT
jgi:hypothetical protein